VDERPSTFIRIARSGDVECLQCPADWGTDDTAPIEAGPASVQEHIPNLPTDTSPSETIRQVATARESDRPSPRDGNTCPPCTSLAIGPVLIADARSATRCLKESALPIE
jgi:hypothetical protein